MKKIRMLWLVYRRLRVGMEAFGFILLYGAYTHNINLALLLVAFGFSFLDIFGGMYNDYYDYETDLRNKRQDKWISAGLVTRSRMLYLGALFALSGLVALYFANIFIFLVGLYYFFIAVCYSHPKIPIGRNLATYLLIGAPYLFMFYIFSAFSGTGFTAFGGYYSLFAFFQSVYLIAHKDVNDKDPANLFSGKYGRGFFVCLFSGALSSAFLFILSAASIGLVALWLLNAIFLKFWLLKRIQERTVERGFRNRIVLFEFLTPYFYSIAIFLGGWFA